MATPNLHEVSLDTMDLDDKIFQRWLSDNGVSVKDTGVTAPNGSGAKVIKYTGTLPALTRLCAVWWDDVSLVDAARRVTW